MLDIKGKTVTCRKYGAEVTVIICRWFGENVNEWFGMRKCPKGSKHSYLTCMVKEDDITSIDGVSTLKEPLSVVVRYRKKPVVVDCMEFTGTAMNYQALMDWMGKTWSRGGSLPDGLLYIKTLEDLEDTKHIASVGDFIIKGVAGEFYACKPDIFHRTYEAV